MRNTQEPSAFRGTAWYYARYRKPYPDELLRQMVRRFGLDGTGRLLDVGCGTGQLSIPLAGRFDEVLGIDSSTEMVAVATNEARRMRVGNATFRALRGEEVSGALGRFRLAAFGSSLHWMAMDDVLRRCRSVLAPGGGLAIVAMRSIWGGDTAWERIVVARVREWLGAGRRAGAGTFVEPVRNFEEAVADAGFSNMESGEIPCAFGLDVDFILGHLYSTSYCNRALLGDRVGAFERDLEAALLEVEPSGRFSWRPRVYYLLADSP